MKIILIKETKINGIKKPSGLVMEVTNGYGAELIKKKKAKEYTFVEPIKEVKKEIKEDEKVEVDNETTENNN